MSDIAREAGREMVERIRSSHPHANCLFVRADAAKPEDNEALAQAAVDEYGALHIACGTRASAAS